ncbi:MAG: MFS transporter [Prolixibacteraceae bacterium]|nr:MFS transporter [Prolixibacteraceae bacterium]
MRKKPTLSFWQIWNMSFGFLGIQFGFALQNANVSRIFETLGANVEDIPILWIAAPVTGLIVQPIIGHMSDKTWNRLGRRHPYFLSGAIFASLALLMMPNSPTLWVAAGTLWIMDASINISMEPFRAFVGDMLPNDQRTQGFAMQSFFIGTGAVVGSLLPYVMTNWLNIPNTAPEGIIPPSVRWSFYIGAVVFFSAITWTIFTTREYPPEKLKEYDESEKKTTETRHGINEEPVESRNFRKVGSLFGFLGLLIVLVTRFLKLEKELYILGGILFLFFLLMMLAAAFKSKKEKDNALVEIFSDLLRMPLTMRQLAIVQFFTWIGLFSMWIYTTAGVTSAKYDMKLDEITYQDLNYALATLPENLPETANWDNLESVKEDMKTFEGRFAQNKKVVASIRVVKFFTDEKKLVIFNLKHETLSRLETIQEEYNNGADWVGILMSVYNGFAAIMAFVIVFMARKIRRTTVHSICLLIGGLSLASFYFMPDPKMLMISELGIGLAWASILSMPYAILTGSLPAKKMGVYMGIFNFFIVIPQILAATILGFMVKDIFGGEAILALVFGGVSMIVAAVLVLFVKDVQAGNK